MLKLRLDDLMHELGLTENITQAQRLIMAGQVRIDGQVVLNPSIQFPENVDVSIDQAPRYVSRGGDKLEAALLAFGMQQLSGCVAADIGSSTGGFTDCLLQHGASRVYAIDVGYGILDWKLRSDSRVTVMERTNARNVERLPDAVDLVTIDASFISLRTLLPVITTWYPSDGGRAIALIKPQFEASRKDAARGKGVIRDSSVHQKVLTQLIMYIENHGFKPIGLIRSPLIGAKGNVEFLVQLDYPANGRGDIEKMIQSVLPPSSE